MNKFSLVPLAIIALVGVVWATSSLPDTPEFPSNPNNPWTLGYILSYFGSDGTAPNTEKLWGISASGYLRGANCPTDQVWKGIDTSGQAICGSRGVLLAFAKILEGSMQVNGKTKPPGTILYENDRIDTNVGQTGTIQFINDISIARLSTSTSIILERGNTAGTIAQVVLDQGLLWWRVLTSTWINIGGGGLIAGVRGTSVSVEKWTNSLTIVDSRITGGGSVGELSSSKANTITWTAKSKPLSVLSRWDTRTDFANSSPLPGMSKSALLTENQWIRENLKKDIVYLNSLGGNSIASAELAAITPQWSERDAICINYDWEIDGRWWDNTIWCKPRWLIAYADYTKDTDMILGYTWPVTLTVKESNCPYRWEVRPNLWSDETKKCWEPITLTCDTNQILVSHTMSCPSFKPSDNPALEYTPWIAKNEAFGSNWWEADCEVRNQFGTTNKNEKHTWFDPTSGLAILNIWCATPGIQRITNNGIRLTPGTNGVSITGALYLQYKLPDYNILKGKTIEIWLTSSLTNGTLIDLNSNTKIAYISWKWQYNVWSWWTAPSDTSIIEHSPDNYSWIKFKVPKEASVDKLIIWNNSNIDFKSPIRTNIKHISIY